MISRVPVVYVVVNLLITQEDELHDVGYTEFKVGTKHLIPYALKIGTEDRREGGGKGGEERENENQSERRRIKGERKREVRKVGRETKGREESEKQDSWFGGNDNEVPSLLVMEKARRE